jgi:glyoxylase-like metal-dependent hydrolase (beta-lactamase superfamily II)
MVDMLQQQVPGHDLSQVGQLTALPPGADQVPWDGPEARLVIHDGHTPGHMAVFLPGPGVLIAGDMVSGGEIPLLDTEADDAFGDYQAGLEALARLDGVRWVVPGHGYPGDGAEFRRRVDLDRRYLDRLLAGQPFTDPRCTEDWMRDHHEKQLAYVAARGAGAAGGAGPE